MRRTWGAIYEAVSDVTSKLSSKEMADLCALADGTLPAHRRAEVEAWVAASPELQDLLERQRRSLTATQALASEPVPDSLREAVEARRRRTSSRPVQRRSSRTSRKGAQAASRSSRAADGGTRPTNSLTRYLQPARTLMA